MRFSKTEGSLEFSKWNPERLFSFLVGLVLVIKVSMDFQSSKLQQRLLEFIGGMVGS